MNTQLAKNIRSGFTLIEVVIYIALFSILIGGVVVSVYNIFESSGRDGTESQLVEEGNFLLGKVGWVMSGVQTINTPAANTSGTTLSVTKFDTSIGNPIVMRSVGNNLTLSRGVNLAQILNNTNTWITAASFTHTLDTGQGFNPESVEITFTINTRTPSGATVSQMFENTYYLQK